MANYLIVWRFSARVFLPLVVSVFTALSSGLVFAHGSGDSFAVQVGAYRELDETAQSAMRQSLSAYGAVQFEQAGEWQRVLVGELQARESAELLRQKLLQAGYAEAFVQRRGAQHSHASPAHVPEPAQRDYSALQKLTPEQRARAVYLDGVLHLKQGDTFTKVE